MYLLDGTAWKFAPPRRSEDALEHRADAARSLGEAALGDAPEREAGVHHGLGLQRVALEALRVGVRPRMVELDHHALRPPEAVDLPAGDVLVELRRGKAPVADGLGEAALEVHPPL